MQVYIKTVFRVRWLSFKKDYLKIKKNYKYFFFKHFGFYDNKIILFFKLILFYFFFKLIFLIFYFFFRLILKIIFEIYFFIIDLLFYFIYWFVRALYFLKYYKLWYSTMSKVKVIYNLLTFTYIYNFWMGYKIQKARNGKKLRFYIYDKLLDYIIDSIRYLFSLLKKWDRWRIRRNRKKRRQVRKLIIFKFFLKRRLLHYIFILKIKITRIYRFIIPSIYSRYLNIKFKIFFIFNRNFFKTFFLKNHFIFEYNYKKYFKFRKNNLNLKKLFFLIWKFFFKQFFFNIFLIINYFFLFILWCLYYIYVCFLHIYMYFKIYIIVQFLSNFFDYLYDRLHDGMNYYDDYLEVKKIIKSKKKNNG